MSLHNAFGYSDEKVTGKKKAIAKKIRKISAENEARQREISRKYGMIKKAKFD